MCSYGYCREASNDKAYPDVPGHSKAIVQILHRKHRN